MSNYRNMALGSLVRALHLEYGDYNFDIVCRGWHCYVHRNGIEQEISGRFAYYHKQARRKVTSESDWWKKLGWGD